MAPGEGIDSQPLASAEASAPGGLRSSYAFRSQALSEQVQWLIRLRWIAVVCIVCAVLTGTYILPVLTSPVPIHICAALLLLCNAAYYVIVRRKSKVAGLTDTAMAMIQVEADLIILTAVLHFSGGLANPFILFYVFPIIVATIVLPRDYSFAAALTAIALFGVLAVNEIEDGVLFGSHPLRLSLTASLWQNPVYVLSAFVAFVSMVVIARYLTAMIIERMIEKEAEAARHHDLLRAIITAMSEGLIFVTPDRKVSICNPAASRWRKAAESPTIEGFPEPLTAFIRDLLESADRGDLGESIHFSTEGAEVRDIEARSSAVIGEDGRQLGHVIVGKDLTEHKKLEQELRERTEDVTAINEMLKMSRIEMAQREKMVAIGQMATGIAHEIGNPLASLSSVVQYLRRKSKDAEQSEPLSVIDHQVSRISTILKRMLSLSRPTTSEYKWTDIDELISNTISLIQFDKRVQSVTIENVGTTDLPVVWLNPQLIEQVLLNIFINAIDAMIAKQTDERHVLTVTRRSVDQMIEVRISDTGIGMSPQVCRKAFDSFFTTKEIGKGTGLGLFISYNLVTEIDGTIELESEPGIGTTAIIRIPVRPKTDLIDGGEDKAVSAANVSPGAEERKQDVGNNPDQQI